MRHWIEIHLFELSSDLVFAVLCALAFDLLNPDSATRRALRRINNRLSEYSKKRTESRIEQLEAYKDQIVSGRGAYLLALQTIFAILAMFAGVVGLQIAAHSRRTYPYFIQGPLSFDDQTTLLLIAIVLTAIRGTRLAAVDTKSKLTKKQAGVDRDIAELRSKLRNS